MNMTTRRLDYILYLKNALSVIVKPSVTCVNI